MNILEIKNFSFSYPQAKKQSLTEINLEIEEGSFVVLCGKSGCGKSTLLRQLKSVLAPYGKKEGKILYYGTELGLVDDRKQSSEIGFVLQNPDNQIVTDKVWHELAFGLESLGMSSEIIRLRVAEMASYFGIQNWFMRNVSELSGGQRQLLNLAAIMAMHPKLLILDEPTSMLDPIAASDFLETVKKINQDIGTTVILTEHRLQDVIPQADKIVVMDQGQILVEGGPEKIGKFLKNGKHGMFLSMPVPMQIYAAIDNDLPCPLIVSQGRRWISNLLKDQENILIPKSQYKNTVQSLEKHEKKSNSKDDNAWMENDNLAAKASQKSAKKRNIDPAIEISDVWFRYLREGNDIIRDLSLKVEQGEFYACVGGNGTGKSTTLSLISRIYNPYRGKIKLYGKDIRKYSDKELYQGTIGVLPQNPQTMFLKKTVREDIYSLIGGSKENKRENYDSDLSKAKAVAGIASLCGLEELMDRHPYDLSGGEQQRLALAKVLLMRPKLLLMDEPTKGMDAEYKDEFGKILKRLQAHGITIFMISHDVEFVSEYADRVGLFFEGNIVTSRSSKEFFAGNSFYTTAANRMARHYFPDAVTREDVIQCLRMNLTSS